MNNIISSMREETINKVRCLETTSSKLPQWLLQTDHVLHAGLYARTICIPEGIVITGALIKIATLLIINGNVSAFTDAGTIELTGYNVIAASANRKQAFLARTETHMTMIFPTQATTIEAAEEQFTDELHLLISRNELAINTINITGE